MKQIDEIPQHGQFVVIYSNENGIWCDTYRWEGGDLLWYSDEKDEFETVELRDILDQLRDSQNVTYFTL